MQPIGKTQEVDKARERARQRQRLAEQQRTPPRQRAPPPPPTTPPPRGTPQRPATVFRATADDESSERPPIYAVPTTDTLGDESLLYSPYAVRTPTRYLRPFQVQSAPPARRKQSHARPKPTPIRRRRYPKRTGHCDFQHIEDYMTVGIQSVNVAVRSAFDTPALLSLADWRRLAEEGSKLRKASMAKRMSPSWQHLVWLHRLHARTIVRQVQFSPSTSRTADLAEEDSELPRRRDGRYRSIDPVKATVAVLPSTAPVLSNKKVRLPMRADVGFPNASEEEIRLKQAEIAHETEWEEASPRLVVLVTSDDLGKAVVEEKQRLTRQHARFNGGGLPGIPYAGRELIAAKERNAKHFGQPSTGLDGRPNRYSMLAPPLDASYSPSQGWRPRPFHDRLPGMRYCLACPLEVSFGVGAVEPLVGSLALYSLPAGKPIKKDQAFGKMSEEFWFPAGDWSGKVELAAAQKEDGSMDKSLLDAWLKRKHKAVYSYDPLSIPDGALDSVYVVLHVYRLAGDGDLSAYLHKNRDDCGQSVKQIRQRADHVFQQFGAKILTPFCFGVSRVYSDDDMNFPLGVTREMKLLAYPSRPMTQEAFVGHLAAVVEPQSGPDDIDAVDIGPDALSDGGVLDKSSPVMETPTKKLGSVARLFRTPIKSKPPASPQETPATTNNDAEDTELDGIARLFISSLETDFLQCMLSNPSAWGDAESDGRLPRLLVDVSGDLAVLADPSSRAVMAGESPSRKRSSLVRLPVTGEPAGYVSSSEFREVLPLPARPEKHYDVDVGLTSRSLLNLIYLYPRLLKLPVGSKGFDKTRFTLRISVLHSIPAVDESGNAGSLTAPLAIFHSRVPWAGGALVEEVYTKVFGATRADLSQPVNLDSGVPVYDELKLRLPFVLDGSYSLQFELFAVNTAEMELSLEPLADAAIPLSTSMAREQGGRVATIIPNGNHRLKLGDFQLHLETRLISSVHVGDPAVASVLRDFPCAVEQEHDEEQGDGIGGVPRSLSRSTSLELLSLGNVFPKLLSGSSPSSVANHFEALLQMHLCNLVNLHVQGRRRDADSESKIMIGTMESLLEVFRKVKAKFSSVFGDGFTEQLDSFIKRQLDLFDEASLSSSVASIEAQLGDGPVDSSSVAPIDNSNSEEDDEEEDTDEGAVRIISRTGKRDQHDQRMARIIDALGPSGIPFSRVAFGANKMDRMRIEAELRNEVSHFGHFFEDDETIATSPTLLSPIETRTVGDENELRTVTGTKQEELSSDSSIVKAGPANSRGDSADHPGAEFAERVRTVAQVMLAPCVGPSLSNILTKGKSSPSKGEKPVSPVAVPLQEVAPTASKDLAMLCTPGSEVDDEETLSAKGSSGASLTGPSGAVLRGPSNGPLFIFSVRSVDGHVVPVACGQYLYESIMLLWLRAWLDHVEDVLTEPTDTSSLSGRPFVTFAIPELDVQAATPKTIFSCYAHLDILLPLCLKSIVLRYGIEVLPVYPPATRVALDECHLLVFEPFVECLARGLIGMGLDGLGSRETRDKALTRALSSSEVVVEFLIGLMDVLHPEYVHSLFRQFFKTLRDCETEHLGDSLTEVDFVWTEESLHRVRCSRQFRLRAAEMLSSLPMFLALNYPPKYSTRDSSGKLKRASWRQQYVEIPDELAATTEKRPTYPDGVERLPPPSWLSSIVIDECMSVCTLSCEAVVAEAMAHGAVAADSKNPSSLKKRPGATLTRADLLMFQSMAIHAITCVYELVLRRHSMDRRFQTPSSRERIAGLFAGPLLDRSIESARWLARMESTHKVRSLWLLCFVYVLQEAPESLVREYVRSLCNPKDIRIHRFIRLLRLSSSTFQSFVDLPRHATFPSEIDKGMSPWLLQESFNTVCAATNVVVEECVSLTSSYPHEQEKMMTGILDLLLHLLTTPQSAVTHLRAVGGALQALEQFGVDLLLEITGASIQNWIRVILSLMNSTSLSVRSIAVDFVVSLLGHTYDRHGDINSLAIVFLTVLPEVAAREIALYSVSGLVKSMDDVARALWPLRRSIADLEDANPLDDDRVDPQLSPILSVFCRASQAVMDGVLVEMRLKGDAASVVGSKLEKASDLVSTFDADEESLFEAAMYFVPETAPMQRLRWLVTLKSLQEAKGHCVEAAESLYLCARTITDAIPHLRHVWRPARFELWSDARRSLWLETVGEELGYPERGNAEVMGFADEFLEPSSFLGTCWGTSTTGKLQQPTIPMMSNLLGQVAKEAVELYLREDGMDELAHLRFEALLKSVMDVMEEYSSFLLSRGGLRTMGTTARKRYIEDETELRKALASVSGDMTRLAERLLLVAQTEPSTPEAGKPTSPSKASRKRVSQPKYVVVRVTGKKPQRFLESTTLPTFLEFDAPCICRLPPAINAESEKMDQGFDRKLCLKFAEPLLASLRKACGPGSVVLRTEATANAIEDAKTTYLHVFPVDSHFGGKAGSLLSKSFFYRKTNPEEQTTLVEIKVAQPFPCALSRQRALMTTELVPTTWRPHRTMAV